jgi:hypothetical protein
MSVSAVGSEQQIFFDREGSKDFPTLWDLDDPMRNDSVRWEVTQFHAIKMD